MGFKIQEIGITGHDKGRTHLDRGRQVFVIVAALAGGQDVGRITIAQKALDNLSGWSLGSQIVADVHVRVDDGPKYRLFHF